MKHVFSIQVPIEWDEMSQFEQMRYIRMQKRDSTIIKKYLGLIKKEHNSLVSLSNRDKYQIDTGLLDRLTLTSNTRRKVKYDLKRKYQRISNNELQECRETAVGDYLSYLELSKIQKSRLTIDKPRKRQGPLSRTILNRRFQLNGDILSLMDSMDSNWLIIHGIKQKVSHDRLDIPLKISKYHLEQISKGAIASLRFSKRDGMYYVNFSINSEVKKQDSLKNIAVLGIDLGIKKTAFSVVMTSTGIQHRKTWHSDNKFKELSKLENQIASLQREYYHRINNSIPRGNISKKLKELKDQRKIISKEYDRILVKELVVHIQQINKKFNLQIGIGKLKGIRNRGRKGNGKGRKYRKMLNSWAFFRFTKMLEHKLSEIGLKNILFSVNEAWTSIMCYKCNSRGKRPSQSFFKCLNPTCGVRNNADFNGAMNIAKRTVKYRKLTPKSTWSKVGLGRFLRPYQSSDTKTTPKARSRKRKRSSNTVKKKVAISVPVSVATNYQTSIIDSFENDLAMVKKYEKPILVEYANSNKLSGRKRYSPKGDK
ncbi:MAG: zinc ribbon domain-containing protein [Candidatus Kariarchaeaceae archaeon]|jgi:IS605 OrfB family transposase